MKKIFMTVFIFFAATSLAFGEGFQNTEKYTNVKDALKMNNNSYVKVQGCIIKQLSDDKYLFKDSTGTMTVEIDKDKWKGVSANQKTQLELNGEIERKFNKVFLDVDSVRHILP